MFMPAWRLEFARPLSTVTLSCDWISWLRAGYGSGWPVARACKSFLDQSTTATSVLYADRNLRADKHEHLLLVEGRTARLYCPNVTANLHVV